MRARPIDQSTVLDTAMAIIETDGLDAVSLSRIADELGVTQPALYHHVDGVSALWRLIGLRSRAVLADRLRTACVGRSGADAVEAAAFAWIQFAIDHPGLYHADDRYPCAGDAEVEAAVGEIVGILAAALRGYALDDERRRACALTLRNALHGHCAFLLHDGHPLPYDSQRTLQMITILEAGFAAQGATEVAS